uniref:Mitochondrial uncoupling protein 3 n=1 Tax=Phallusia mammillata TaxID=59560 RepID=A0A6F9DVK2_9ASCI|nr:mitochondrial uncoupling protein 3 [Phallusia mammillata]
MASSDGLTVPMKIASAGLAGCTADIFTFPLDTAKVWLQVRGEGVAKGSPNPPPASPMTTQGLKGRKTAGKTLSSSGKPQINRAVSGTKLNSSSKKKLVKVVPVKKPGPIGKYGNMAIVKKNPTPMHNAKFADIGSIKRRIALGPAVPVASASTTSAASAGLVRTLVNGVKNNGFRSLYGGLGAGLQRQMAFCAVRIGLYDSVKEFYHGIIPGTPGGKQIPQRILAGTTSACIAVAMFQPTEVVKIKMQADARKPRGDHQYRTSIQAYRELRRVGGIRELWKGMGTNMARLGVVNVCELVTYDIVKETILDLKLLGDNPICHFSSAFISGFITTMIASPIDVVKTRYMNSPMNTYRGPIHCAKTMLFNEGVLSFYKGFVPSYLRLGSWNIVMFVSYEQYKILSRKMSHQYEPKHTYVSDLK